MKVEERKLCDLKPYAKNPRVNEGAVESVARSIREFGFRRPVVVDDEDVIIVGHTRYKAAQKLGHVLRMTAMRLRPCTSLPSCGS